MNKKIALLKDRAQMLARARQFFSRRGVLEVDCPMISRYAAVDEHIDLIPVQYGGMSRRYLHSSPEYGMKRLLVEGMGDIYQLSHVFRDGEYGRKHNPEFMMAEWYRLGFSFNQMVLETVDFIRLFLGDLPFTSMTYREVFQNFAGFDYFQVTAQELRQYIYDSGIDQVHSIAGEDKDGLLNVILGLVVEPQLGRNGLFILTHYPASQAALAQTVRHDDENVAERFEVYFEGIELANGYHELANPHEQRQRLIEANRIREERLGKEVLPIDEHFLAALEQGLPNCCGVAVGFDRLMMLRNKCLSLAEAMPFDWDSA